MLCGTWCANDLTPTHRRGKNAATFQSDWNISNWFSQLQDDVEFFFYICSWESVASQSDDYFNFNLILPECACMRAYVWKLKYCVLHSYATRLLLVSIASTGCRCIAFIRQHIWFRSKILRIFLCVGTIHLWSTAPFQTIICFEIKSDIRFHISDHFNGY